MNKNGKTLTIFLVIISILLISLASIITFFFMKEREMRKDLEGTLSKARGYEDSLQTEIKDLKEQKFLMEEKEKEADERINNLLDELELQEGLREELKLENVTWKEKFDNEQKVKEQLRQDLSDTQVRIKELEGEVREGERVRLEIEEKARQFAPEEGQIQSSGDEGETETTQANKNLEGTVLTINYENDFIIFSLGSVNGLTEGMVMSVFRDDEYLGDVKVSRVQSKMSVADFIPPLTSKEVSENDKVVFKK